METTRYAVWVREPRGFVGASKDTRPIEGVRAWSLMLGTWGHRHSVVDGPKVSGSGLVRRVPTKPETCGRVVYKAFSPAIVCGRGRSTGRRGRRRVDRDEGGEEASGERYVE